MLVSCTLVKVVALALLIPPVDQDLDVFFWPARMERIFSVFNKIGLNVLKTEQSVFKRRVKW